MNAIPDDIDGGPVIAKSSLEAICSYLEYNPKTRNLRFQAPKTKTCCNNPYEDYNSAENFGAHDIASSVEYKFPTAKSNSDDSEESSSSEYSNEGEGFTTEASEAEGEPEVQERGQKDEYSEAPTTSRRAAPPRVTFELPKSDISEKSNAEQRRATPQKQSLEKEDSKDDSIGGAGGSILRNAPSGKNEQDADSTVRINFDAKSLSRSSSIASAGHTNAANNSGDNADDRSVDRRPLSKVSSVKSGKRSRPKRKANPVSSSAKRKKGANVHNPFTKRSGWRREDVERAFGRRAAGHNRSNYLEPSSAESSESSAENESDEYSSGGGGGGVRRSKRNRTSKRSLGRIINAGVPPADVKPGAKSSKRIRKRRNGKSDDDDTWAAGKSFPLDSLWN
ncbi:unnamed protein product [Oikopleura dioica]|uniref:Uncharacterized protein n=1 Tax=Oikopleura dioica TaxID=34765 RepID=E4Y0C6_OIKDI|nr:unnamed protein product [Oikopleura dioica]